MKKTKTIKLPATRGIVEVPKNGKPKIKLDVSFGDLLPNYAAQGYVRLKTITCGHWDLEDESVEAVFSAYMLNRMDGVSRLKWMDELYRVLIPSGQATILVPYWTSKRSIQDPFSQAPALCEESFLYFNKQWREANKHNDYCKCDFDFTYGYSYDPETLSRSQDTQPFWVKHYTNAVQDLQVVLIKK